MRVSMDIELQDAPGQLVQALKPISEFKVTLLLWYIIMRKERPVLIIPVQVVFETDAFNVSPLTGAEKPRRRSNSGK